VSRASHSCRHASQDEQTTLPVRSVVALTRVQPRQFMFSQTERHGRNGADCYQQVRSVFAPHTGFRLAFDVQFLTSCIPRLFSATENDGRPAHAGHRFDLHGASDMPPRFIVSDLFYGPVMNAVFFSLASGGQPLPVDANLAHQFWREFGLREVKAAASHQDGGGDVFGAVHFLYLAGSATSFTLVMTCKLYAAPFATIFPH
jgi:hypothetical protein